MTLDEALLALNDRLGHEFTAWVEVSTTRRCSSPAATSRTGTWTSPTSRPAAGATHFDLYGHYSLGDTRFDLSDAPVESVAERDNGLTFRLQGGARLVVTWQPLVAPDDLV